MTVAAPARTLKLAKGFELPLSLVTEATAIVATRGAGKSSGSAVVVEEAFGVGVQCVVFDRTGVYWGLRSNAKGDGPGLPIYVLGGPHGDVPLEAHAGVMIADLVVDSGHSFVLDLSDFSKSAAIKFAADFLERLYDIKARSRSTTLLVMDEAHFYAPQTPRGGFKGDSARLMGAMEDVVGLGRSRGLGVILTTQRTQALNKAVLDLIETLFVMRMLSPRAREAVRAWIQEKHEDDELGVIASLDSLPTGTAWVWAPLRGILEKVALRRIKTFDSYKTPEPGEAAVEPTVRKELDLSALGAQMKATVEKAKENDPAELRKKIREMEIALALRPEAGEPVTVEVPVEIEKIVEVPVFTDEDRAWLEKISKALDAIPEQLRPIEVGLGELWGKVAALSAPRPVEKILTGRVVEKRQRPPMVIDGGFKPLKTTRQMGVDAPDLGRPLGEAAGDLSGPEQRVLDALVWFELLQIPQPTKQQVGFIAGYKVGKNVGGTYGNTIGRLRSRGLIDYPSGNIALTAEGRKFARDPGIPATNGAIQQAVLERLSGPERRVLEVLIEVWPRSMTKQDLGAAAGYTVGSNVGGTFGNIIGKLRNTMGVIDYPSPGEAVALDVLFPLG